jgi:hypothetical protein
VLVGGAGSIAMSSFIKRDVLGWGLLLWLVGYLLGFVFYAFVPPAFIGWFVMPIGIGLACIVLWKLVQVDSIRDSAGHRLERHRDGVRLFLHREAPQSS